MVRTLSVHSGLMPSTTPSSQLAQTRISSSRVMLPQRSQPHNQAARVLQQAQQQRWQYLPPLIHSWPLHRASLQRSQRVHTNVCLRAVSNPSSGYGCGRRQALLASGGLLLGVLGTPAGQAEAGLLQFPANELHNRYHLVRPPAVFGCLVGSKQAGGAGGTGRSSNTSRQQGVVTLKHSRMCGTVSPCVDQHAPVCVLLTMFR
jgi:hypothetical protein